MELTPGQRKVIGNLDNVAARLQRQLGEPDAAVLERLDALIKRLVDKKGTEQTTLNAICWAILAYIAGCVDDVRAFLDSVPKDLDARVLQRPGGLTMENFLTVLEKDTDATTYRQAIAAINSDKLAALWDTQA